MDQSYISSGLAIAVCFIVARWVYTQATAPAGSDERPTPTRVVPEAQIEAVCAAFPQVTPNQARWDLGRSGSVETTIEKILRDGRLPDPPPGLFPNTPAPTTSSRPATSAGLSTNAQNLIAKYGLQSRIEADIKGKGKETQPESLQSWATTASDREKILKERKARMVLEARRKMMEKEAQKLS